MTSIPQPAAQGNHSPTPAGSPIAAEYQALTRRLHTVHERRLARADRQAEQRQGGRG